jgi:hypothetical protein
VRLVTLLLKGLGKRQCNLQRVVSKHRDWTCARGEGLCHIRGVDALGEHRKNVGWVGIGTVEAFLDHSFKRTEGLGVDVEFPLEVIAHIMSHLVNLSQREPLSDDSPE